MERVVDNCILYGCSLYILCLSFSGNETIPVIYLSLACAAAMIWLIPEDRESEDMEIRYRRMAGLILLDILLLVSFWKPGIAGFLPLIVYHHIFCRHPAGLGLALGAYLNVVYLSISTGVPQGEQLIFLTVAIILGGWLCQKTVRLTTQKKKIRMLRDDAEERERYLQRQNEELLMAKDSEVTAAQMAERNRIAREIHDNVGHTLSRGLLQVGALLAVHKEEPYHSELSGVRETMDNAMNSIRSSVHDLHDSSVDMEGTIRQMIRPLESSFRVFLNIDDQEDMPRELKFGLIGIVREAVSNILRHSRNDTVSISFLRHPGLYQLIIHDYLSEGGSLRTAPVSGKNTTAPGIGLTNMESRAAALGGSLFISEDKGFRVFVSIPRKE